jgi:hypothetical protein
MIANFKDLEKSFPPSREYSSSSNHLPLTFFDSIFPISKTIDIWLGYFTTNSFRILSLPLREKKIVAYPDKGCYQDWNKVANNLNRLGYNIKLSILVENLKIEHGADIADVFLRSI